MKRKEFKKAVRGAIRAARNLQLHEMEKSANDVTLLVHTAIALESQVRRMVKSEDAQTADIAAVFADMEKRRQKGKRGNLLGAIERIEHILEGRGE